MKVGFTGTQVGMTGDQAAALGNYILDDKRITGTAEFHHGDCIGADAQAHDLAWILGLSIVVHPPVNESKRAFCGILEDDSVSQDVTILAAQDYIRRNHNIVDGCDLLIVAPRGTAEEVRSGTWATLRYAERKGKEVVVIWPNGETEKWSRDDINVLR